MTPAAIELVIGRVTAEGLDGDRTDAVLAAPASTSTSCLAALLYAHRLLATIYRLPLPRQV